MSTDKYILPLEVLRRRFPLIVFSLRVRSSDNAVTLYIDGDGWTYFFVLEGQLGDGLASSPNWLEMVGSTVKEIMDLTKER